MSSFRFFLKRLSERLSFKFHWTIANKIPPKSALYAFVRVHAVTGEGPCDCGYTRPYNLFVEDNNIKDT